MLTINEYRKVESLEEAYELNQKKNNKIIAGGVWMKIGDRRIAVPQLCNRRWKYFRTFWFFRCTDRISGNGYPGRTVSCRYGFLKRIY